MNRNHSITLAALLLAGAIPTVIAADGSSIDALLKDARSTVKQNDPTATRAAYEKVLAAPDATQAQKITALTELAGALAGRKQWGDAAKEYDRALALPGLPAAERFKVLNTLAKMRFGSNFDGALASYADDGISAAAAIYEKIAADPEASNADRVEALKNQANCLLEKMDVKGANALLERAVALPGLVPDEKNTARFNLARAYERELEYAKARKIYEELRAADAKGLKGELERRIADTQAAETEKVTVPQSYRDDDGGATALRQTLSDTQQEDKERWTAFEKLWSSLIARGQYAEARKLYETYAAGFLAKEPKRGNPLVGLLYQRQLNTSAAGFDEFAAWATRTVLAMPNVSAKDAAAARNRLFNSLIGMGQIADACKVVQDMLAASNAPAARLQLQLVVAALKTPEAAAESAKAAQAVLAAVKRDDIPAKDQADAVLYAARVAMQARYYATADALDKIREAMLVPEPRRSITCPFLADTPGDISGWLASPLWKDAAKRGKLDRKYGDNLQFILDTDSSTVGRKVGDSTAAPVQPTEFIVACDADGVTILTVAPSQQMDAIADGFAGMGGYETYLTPGEHAPYYCFLVDNGKLSDGFVTQYENRNFREARLDDGTIKSETRITPEGIATRVLLSWELFYNNLPSTGDKWQYDNIHWEGGGYTWGGTKTVHGRSPSGDIVFANMTPENLVAIKRRVIVKALAKYRAQKSGGANGVLDYWQDPELGDREFYLASVKPLVTKLDAYVPMVKKGMTAEDVETVFKEAVPSWMAIKYVIADLRKDYLDRKRIENR